jgi:hypothetical protein
VVQGTAVPSGWSGIGGCGFPAGSMVAAELLPLQFSSFSSSIFLPSSQLISPFFLDFLSGFVVDFSLGFGGDGCGCELQRQ